MISDFDELDDLYQQVILDHSRRPRNFHALEEADASSAEGHNPLCGDRVTIFVRRAEARIADVAFTGKGCAICTACASMMTQAVKGRPVEEIDPLFDHFHHMLTENLDPADEDALGKLAVFHGVRKYPVRVKCASLPWHTLKAAMENQGDTITTE